MAIDVFIDQSPSRSRLIIFSTHVMSAYGSTACCLPDLDRRLRAVFGQIYLLHEVNVSIVNFEGQQLISGAIFPVSQFQDQCKEINPYRNKKMHRVTAEDSPVLWLALAASRNDFLLV
jgi:hypothetical protein